MSLPQLNFPKYDFRLRENESRPEIFDEVRKKWVTLTPEEWVRQHVAKWLVEEKKYPAGLLAVEKSIQVNGLTKRCDIVASDRNGKPILIVECKAHDVEISQLVFDQTARYNMTLKVDLFLITNGLRHFCCNMDTDNNSYVFLKELPLFPVFPG
jgi:type I site-specific restriction endonuclease